jgi:hypothetical protein
MKHPKGLHPTLDADKKRVMNRHSYFVMLAIFLSFHLASFIPKCSAYCIAKSHKWTYVLFAIRKLGLTET